MRRRALEFGLIAATLSLASCPYRVEVFPDLEVVVLDADGAPIAGARVMVHAESLPHPEPDDPTLELTTDADGRVHVAERIDWDRGCPLMIHGIGAYRPHLCVDHPTLGGAVDERFHDSGERVELHLGPAQVDPGIRFAAGHRCGIDQFGGIDLMPIEAEPAEESLLTPTATEPGSVHGPPAIPRR